MVKRSPHDVILKSNHNIFNHHISIDVSAIAFFKITTLHANAFFIYIFT